MKALIAVAILFSATFFYLSVAVSAGTIRWGTRGPYDRILARHVVKKEAGWFSKNRVTVVFPPKGHISYTRISAIQVIDRGSSKAKLIEGGPGYSTATIEVKSQTRKPIDMTIEYYGH